MKQDTLDFVLKHYRTQRALARSLCVTEGSVSQSIKTGGFPPRQAINIETAMHTPLVKAKDLIKGE
jgi:DNA-binding transcriptional regulator YdaS (Cro superfamily)